MSMPVLVIPDSLVALINKDDVDAVFSTIDSKPEWKDSASCLKLVMKKAATNGKMKVRTEATISTFGASVMEGVKYQI
jgi:hypothetical protein